MCYIYTVILIVNIHALIDILTFPVMMIYELRGFVSPGVFDGILRDVCRTSLRLTSSDEGLVLPALISSYVKHELKYRQQFSDSLSFHHQSETASTYSETSPVAPDGKHLADKS